MDEWELAGEEGRRGWVQQQGSARTQEVPGIPMGPARVREGCKGLEGPWEGRLHTSQRMEGEMNSLLSEGMPLETMGKH